MSWTFDWAKDENSVMFFSTQWIAMIESICPLTKMHLQKYQCHSIKQTQTATNGAGTASSPCWVWWPSSSWLGSWTSPCGPWPTRMGWRVRWTHAAVPRWANFKFEGWVNFWKTLIKCLVLEKPGKSNVILLFRLVYNTRLKPQLFPRLVDVFLFDKPAQHFHHFRRDLPVDHDLCTNI